MMNDTWFYKDGLFGVKECTEAEAKYVSKIDWKHQKAVSEQRGHELRIKELEVTGLLKRVKVLEVQLNNPTCGGPRALKKIATRCPLCGHAHVDKGEWATKPHRTHLCENCETTWTPDESTCTVGVAQEDEPEIIKQILELAKKIRW